MKTQVLSNFQWTDLTVVAFLIFIIFFVSMIVWTFRKGTGSLYKSVEDLPFQEPSKLGEPGHE